MASLREIAQWHGEQGFQVVPLHGKRALTRWGREHKQYSSQKDVIAECFNRTHVYTDRVTDQTVTTRADGIGLILEPTGTVVLDLDSDSAVEWARQQARRDPRPFRTAPRVKSPRDGGGLHLYFRQDPTRKPLRQAHGQLHPQVDLKAAGSLVVAAGSLHKTGRRYRLETDKSLFATYLLPTAPEFLYDWQDEKDSKVKEWDQDQSNHKGFEGTIFYHHVKVFSGRGNKLHIECPNIANHSKRDPSGTILFPANKLGGLGQIHCEHASCSGMRARDWKHLIGEEACNQTEKEILR